MTKLPRPDLAAYGLAALALLCMTALLFVGRTVPDYIPLIAMTAMGSGAGMALNTPNGSETLRTPARRPLPAAASSELAPGAGGRVPLTPAPRPAPAEVPAP